MRAPITVLVLVFATQTIALQRLRVGATHLCFSQRLRPPCRLLQPDIHSTSNFLQTPIAYFGGVTQHTYFDRSRRRHVVWNALQMARSHGPGAFQIQQPFRMRLTIHEQRHQPLMHSVLDPSSNPNLIPKLAPKAAVKLNNPGMNPRAVSLLGFPVRQPLRVTAEGPQGGLVWVGLGLVVEPLLQRQVRVVGSSKRAASGFDQ